VVTVLWFALIASAIAAGVLFTFEDWI